MKLLSNSIHQKLTKTRGTFKKPKRNQIGVWKYKIDQMTTEIKPSSARNDKFSSSRKAELLNKIEGIPDDINAAIFIEAENIITVSDDK